MVGSDDLADQVQNLYATRYLSIAGLVLMLYDHSLTFADEVRFIWKAPSSTPKWLFLGMRYSVPVFVIVHLVQMGGMANLSSGLFTHLLKDCVYRMPTQLQDMTLVGIVTIAGGNFLVLLHLWNLWDRNVRLITWTLILFVTTQIANFACGIKVVVTLTRSVLWVPSLHVCVLSSRSDIGILWAPGVLFEVVIFIMVVWNALCQPRKKEQAMSILYRDGVFYFVVLLLLRMLNLFIAFIAPLSLIFLGVFFVWCTTTLAVTRLILNLRHMAELSKFRRMDDQIRSGMIEVRECREPP
ncbi:hypothetical protein CPB85DRAFT_1564505 [Mucidula mucida]|nr:hypothetical protein CPB85DRAFT_1564505 [Mucidula mucida]